MKKLKQILTVCMTLLLSFLCGCNQEDDIFEIFSSGQTWHWSGSYNTNDWKDDNNAYLAIDKQEVMKINNEQDAYNIVFEKDGSLYGNGKSFTFKGKWSAQGNDNSFQIELNTQGNITGTDNIFYNDIKNARFYRGNSKLIKLFNEKKKRFIQFYPKGFNQ